MWGGSHEGTEARRGEGGRGFFDRIDRILGLTGGGRGGGGWLGGLGAGGLFGEDGLVVDAAESRINRIKLGFSNTCRCLL